MNLIIHCKIFFLKPMNEKTNVENQQLNISQKNYRESAENPTENLLGIFLRSCQDFRQMHLYFVFVYCLYLLKFVSNKYLTGFKTKPNLCPAKGFFYIEAQFKVKMFFFLFGVNREDGRSTIVSLLYWQTSQGPMADFPAFIASKSFDL